MRTQNSEAKNPISVERARKVLCQHVEQCCEQGASNVKVRVNTEISDDPGVWFYGRIANAWRKSDTNVEGANFGSRIADELDRLAAAPCSEECQVRRKEFKDRIEFEIKFHHDKILEKQGPHLGSYLYGVLFHERHAPPNPKRQGNRRGPTKRVLIRR